MIKLYYIFIYFIFSCKLMVERLRCKITTAKHLIEILIKKRFNFLFLSLLRSTKLINSTKSVSNIIVEIKITQTLHFILFKKNDRLNILINFG